MTSDFSLLDPNLPIGVFDSGVGGLTVARAIRDQLPHEAITYLGDTARTPYGPRPQQEVRQFSLEMLDQLVAEGVKMLVIACNTASTAVFEEARERYSVPVVEVIRPTVRHAVSLSRTGNIGLLGTETTVRSGVYDELFAACPGTRLTAQAAPRFVELVEAGVTAGAEVEAIAAQYVQPLLAAQIDTLVLGCTHYPFLQAALRQVVGPDIALVTSGDETAAEVYRILREHGLLRSGSDAPNIKYAATGTDTAAFQKLAKTMLGIQVDRVDHMQTGVIDLPKL